MMYRIEYADGNCSSYADSRKELLVWLKILKNEPITDIRKVYKNGNEESVFRTYEKFIGRKTRC